MFAEMLKEFGISEKVNFKDKHAVTYMIGPDLERDMR